MSRKNLIRNMTAGAIAGVAASLAMERFQGLVSSIAAAGGGSNGSEPSTVKAASALSESVLSHRLSQEQKQWAGPAMHYVMGGTSGAMYGMVADAVPLATAATGAVFGAMLWAMADEGAVPALGFSKPFSEYSTATHLKALASHIVYGVTADLVRRAAVRVV